VDRLPLYDTTDCFRSLVCGKSFKHEVFANFAGTWGFDLVDLAGKQAWGFNFVISTDKMRHLLFRNSLFIFSIRLGILFFWKGSSVKNSLKITILISN
jgi:hypothetical protein